MLDRLLKNYQKKLVNLSSNNKCLLLLRLSQENDLDLNELDFLQNEPSFQIIAKLIAGKKKIALSAFIDSRHEKTNVVGKQLQRIERKDKFLFEESGTKDLYVGWPFVRGKFLDDTIVRCPLLFFPVVLLLDNNTWYLSLREDETITFNKNFLLAYQHYNQTTLQEDFVETSFDSFSSDSISFRTQLYELLKQFSLHIHFNADLFIDKLTTFQQYKKESFGLEAETGKIKLYNEAVLGIFPLSGSYLVPDYETLLEKTKEETLEDFISGNPETKVVLKESDIYTPLPIDAPQEEVLKIVKQGGSVVVQGPPGTGKSQLICNLVSDFIGRGKKVLVVCQKRAALDVVYNRLATLGIENFIALVHDFKSDRGSIYQKIGLQIDKVDQYKEETNKLDTVLLDREYKNACKQIDATVEELTSLKDALFDTSEIGVSIKELYLTTKVDSDNLPEIESFSNQFTYESLLSFEKKLEYLLPYALKFDDQEYEWFERKSFSSYTQTFQKQLNERLKELEQFREDFKSNYQEYHKEISFFWNLESERENLERLQLLLKDEISYHHFEKYFQHKKYKTRFSSLIRQHEDFGKRLNELSKKKILTPIKAEEIDYALEIVRKAVDMFGNKLLQLLWKVTSKEKVFVKRLLQDNHLPLSPEGLQELHERLSNFSIFLNLKQELLTLKDFEYTEEATIDGYLQAHSLIKSALVAFEAWNEMAEKHHLTHIDETHTKGQFKKWISSLYKAVDKATICLNQNKLYFTEAHLQRILQVGNFDPLYSSLKEDYDALVEYDKLKEQLPKVEKSILNLLIKYAVSNHPISIPDLINIFKNSIQHGWISRLEEKHPILTSVSTPKIDFLQNVLNQSVALKRNLSSNILKLRLYEQVFKNEEFNRLGNRTTFRDLKHQVSKKKKIWPLRKTLENYAEQVFYALPCWLASPETVSAIFPLEKLFDLVIFDEASQCYAEKGLPSMARAKQFVIAGDDKQLPPGDLYRTRYEEEDEESIETAIDSLLDLGKRFFPQVMLTKHYRSISLDLIQFSNSKFYKDKLELIPHFTTYQKQVKGLEYIYVNGAFEKNQNRVEAELVVSKCLQFFTKTPEKEIGVITFNVHQQHLIQDLLQEHLVKYKLSIPNHFWIKNIENVQGDEKDIILFSIGYSPNALGKVKHHFGTLNVSGGENRLNVAITRAREKNIIVTSLLPHQLNVDEVLNQGPRLLKQFLNYALEVSEGRFVPNINTDTGFRPQWYLKERLKAESKDFKEEVPFADLVQKSQENMLELILTDDDKFFHNKSVKENFCYLPSILNKNGWKFKFIYSRNYYKQK